MMVMNYLNGKVASVNTLFGLVMEKDVLSARNDNGGSFVDFCCFHRFIIGGITDPFRLFQNDTQGVDVVNTSCIGLGSKAGELYTSIHPLFYT